MDASLYEVSPKERAEIYDEMCSVLSKLHQIDPVSIGLGDYGSTTKNYWSRVISTWTKQYRATETQTIKSMEYLIEYLPNNIPKAELSNQFSIVHGDYRLDNVIFHPTEPRIIAVLDWELSTLGSPLADLSNFCTIYHNPINFGGLGRFDKSNSMIPCEIEIRRKYLKFRGFEESMLSDAEWNFSNATTYFKGAGICQGVYKRSQMGNASNRMASYYDKITVSYANLAAAISKGKYPWTLRPVKYSLLTYSSRFDELQATLIDFMERHIFPAEKVYHSQIETGEKRWKVVPAVLFELMEKAKKTDLWNLFLPSVSRVSQLEYAQLCEIMGRSHLAPLVFNCQAPDTGNMEVIAKYGTKEHQEQWLKPLLDGKIRSCFGMTEPGVASSDATNFKTTIVLSEDGQNYVINGRKWWTSGAGDPRCSICILLGVTPNPKKAKHQQHSMVLVPMATTGVKVIRPLTVYGIDDAPHGHMEVNFHNVVVPKSNILLGEGRGFEIAQGRLGPGRIHHCMRLIGLAERALENMMDRSLKRVAFGKALAKHESVLFDIANSRIEIEQARLMTLKAADMIDKEGAKNARKEIAMIKVIAPRVAAAVADRAIQVHGGQGVSGDTILASIWIYARTLRLADGPDEVHLTQIGKMEVMEKMHAKL